ncbi:post-GPI attachment to proteins factor 3-like isoform X2 [Haliotis rufescens]|uniref:post-GPI attachment to proteins factor 3-like isoform X2 n=1 Tax=Haliotis rufescens TaxID=6454 RepID=UPI00201F5099|nr:post-GPI attachment to proteins factor 3-like isoform X2 [Haliotis rufescens]
MPCLTTAERKTAGVLGASPTLITAAVIVIDNLLLRPVSRYMVSGLTEEFHQEFPNPRPACSARSQTMHSSILTAAALSLIYVDWAGASAGDRSWIYQKCVKNCSTSNCTDVETFLQKQPYHLQLLQWNCTDECQYECMWSTVEAFRRDGSGVPQFHGKVGINAWTWSTVFHTRETDFTEKMYYFFGFSIVLYNVFIFSCRILGTKIRWRQCLVGVILLVIYAQHIHYLTFIKFDYGYNMKMNLLFGMVNMVGWLIWCGVKYKKQRYVWKCAAVVLGINALLLLEVFDFPPFWWALDAHALWHAGTAYLGLLWYSFIIDDSLYLKQWEEDMALKLD